MEPINQKLDLIDVEAENSKILPSVLQHLTENNDYYMIRPEEFSLLSEQIKINLIYTNDIIVLRNNLFNKVYPYSKTLSNVQNAFDMLYLNEDTELVGNDRLIIEKINTFYGNINFSKKAVIILLAIMKNYGMIFHNLSFMKWIIWLRLTQ